MTASSPLVSAKLQYVQRGKRLQYFTLFWNSLEAIVAVGAGLVSGSAALVGFGIDSVIEVTSGAASLWRLRSESSDARRERAERITLRAVGICFLALAAYVLTDAIAMLRSGEAPEESPVGIAIATASLVVMPLIARAKRKVAAGLGSAALHADARQTDFCLYLSAILLAGLALNAAFGLWWADPAAALVMVPIIASEGFKASRGHACNCSSSCS